MTPSTGSRLRTSRGYSLVVKVFYIVHILSTNCTVSVRAFSTAGLAFASSSEQQDHSQEDRYKRNVHIQQVFINDEIRKWIVVCVTGGIMSSTLQPDQGQLGSTAGKIIYCISHTIIYYNRLDHPAISKSRSYRSRLQFCCAPLKAFQTVTLGSKY